VLSKHFNPTILIAGFGSIGRRHFRNLRDLGCDKFVFLRSRQGSIEDDEISAWPAVSDIDAALAHKPSIAVISNPSALHLPVALAAARSGCDLFIEKPVSHSLQHCEELQAIACEKQLTTMIGCQFRFHPLLSALRKSVLAGELGEVVGAAAEWGEYLPAWHPWEDHRSSYSARKELGGGVVLTLIHPFDYLYWMFGPSDQVFGITRGVPSLNTPADEDWADVLLRFARNKVVAHVHLDYLQKPPVHVLRVWGDRGRAHLDFHSNRLGYEFPDGRQTEELVPKDFERNTMFIDEMRHFLDCCASDRPTTIPLSEGIDVLQMALGAKAAA
jgi:predicted dehydrogenase